MVLNLDKIAKIKIWLGISLVILGLMVIIGRPSNRMVFCDVGQGDGALVMLGSWQMLIDTGPDNGQMEKCLGKYLPFWDREIEVVVITHWDSDHSGGLQKIMINYKIDSLYANQLPSDKNEQKMYTSDLRAGDLIRFGLMQFEILSPEQISGVSNDDSIVGILSYGTEKILMTADAPAAVEQRLVWRGVLRQAQDIDILKVSHHGSREGTSQELLDTIKPKLAVISVGKNNKFGHPTKEVLERLKNAGVQIWRTDQSLSLEISL